MLDTYLSLAIILSLIFQSISLTRPLFKNIKFTGTDRFATISIWSLLAFCGLYSCYVESVSIQNFLFKYTSASSTIKITNLILLNLSLSLSSFWLNQKNPKIKVPLADKPLDNYFRTIVVSFAAIFVYLLLSVLTIKLFFPVSH